MPHYHVGLEQFCACWKWRGDVLVYKDCLAKGGSNNILSEDVSAGRRRRFFGRPSGATVAVIAHTTSNIIIMNLVCI
jgi:hypothetical protein